MATAMSVEQLIFRIGSIDFHEYNEYFVYNNRSLTSPIQVELDDDVERDELYFQVRYCNGTRSTYLISSYFEDS